MIRLIAAAALLSTASMGARSADAGWPTYGGDPGGQRYSTAAQINRTNVRNLQKVWEYHTHALDSRPAGSYSSSFEATPVLYHGVLYLTSPLDDVIALDPVTGVERWKYHPHLESLSEGNLNTSRGVAIWSGTGKGVCTSRVFLGTNDAQLIALDTLTGKPCADFGNQGSIDLKAGLRGHARDFHITSAPTVLGDTVIVGSSIPDNISVDMPDGTVRAFNARTGQIRWQWDPIPWARSQNIPTGAANTWSTIAADPALGLVYLPTGSASPDYFGGMRPGDDRDADSVVALDAASGRKVWAFQVVHHDLWDYDLAAEPLLFDWHGTVPAIAVITKMGTVFVLDRRTGKPLFPVTEKPSPVTEIPEEVASPTQPVSSVASLSPASIALAGFSPSRNDSDRNLCRKQLATLRYQGPFTPPSIEGTLVFPGAIGGVNWGSAAYDPASGVLYANTNHLPYFAQLIPRKLSLGLKILIFLSTTPILIAMSWVLLVAVAHYAESRRKSKQHPMHPVIVALTTAAILAGVGGRLYTNYRIEHVPKSAKELREIALHAAFGDDNSPQQLAPYSLHRHPILDSHGQPCSPEPWGTVVALNLQTGHMKWQVPHGTQVPGKLTGALSLGGVAVTAGGLVFSAGTREPLLRAYDSDTGQELWQGALPVPAQATPMSYEIVGRQFVVIAAGGHGLWGTPQGDSVVAFALP